MNGCLILLVQLVEWVVEDAQEFDFIILSGDIISLSAQEVTRVFWFYALFNIAHDPDWETACIRSFSCCSRGRHKQCHSGS
jgi:hypothetical protein